MTFAVSIVNAQDVAPPIAWQKSYERTGYIVSTTYVQQNQFYSVREMHKTPSGGYVATGEGSSTSSNFRGVILYDSLGNIERIKNYNELPNNYSTLNNFVFNKITPLEDGSFIATGKTNINTGIFSGVENDRGKWDGFVMKLNDTLGIEWLKRYGGPENDELLDIIPILGGGYLAIGTASQAGGDVTQKRDSTWVTFLPYVGPPTQMASTDWWIIKLDNSGNILQDKCVGGNQPYDILGMVEVPSGVIQHSNGDFIISGVSSANDLDITNPIPMQRPGNPSFWIVRMNSNLEIVWNKSIGGSSYDFIGSSILEMNDGNVVISGNSSSIDGDMDGIGHGGGQYVFDIYLAKLDINNGNILWNNCYGGGGDDFLYVNTASFANARVSAKNVVKTLDGNIAFAATSNELGSTGNEQLADNNVWVVKVNSANGSIIWDRSYGGSGADGASALMANEDGSLSVFGTTYSIDGDLHGERYPQNHNLGAMWLINLAPCDDSITLYKEICGGDSYDFNGRLLTESGIYYDTTGNEHCKFFETLHLTVRAGFSAPIASTSENMVIAGEGYNSYQWFFNGDSLSIKASQLLASQSGEYKLLVTDSLSCVSDATEYTFIFDGCEAPEGEWAKSYGGSGNDQIFAVRPVDGGYIMAGQTNSTDGDVRGLHGTANDFWIVKINNNGDTIWTKTLGGNGADVASDLRITSDGGFVLVGNSTLNAVVGDVTATRPLASSSQDIWVIKFDADANQEWQYLYGGSGADQSYSIMPVADGYIISGLVANASANGTLEGTVSNGGVDSWVLKLNTDGTHNWNKRLGAGGADHLYSIKPTLDGGYIAVGYSTYNASSGTLQETPRPMSDGGGNDVWVLKLDAQGNTVWQKLYGGSGSDIAYSVLPLADGTYIVSGFSASVDGTLENIEKAGGNDYWVLKLNALGDIEWQKVYGGSGSDQITSYDIIAEADGYVFAGTSNSVDGQSTGNSGGNDYWVIKTDLSGNLEWQRTFGGLTSDQAFSIVTANDGGYLVAGTAANNSGIADAKGGNDGYVVKMSACQTCTTPFSENICEGSEYDFNGRILTDAGLYRDTTLTDDGCQRISVVTLSIIPVKKSILSVVICEGETLEFGAAVISAAGTYTDTLQAENGCDSLLTLNLILLPLPSPVVTQEGNTLSTGAFGAYQWFKDGIAISGAEGQSLAVTENGNYTVSVKDGNGCENESETKEVVVSGVKNALIGEVKLYPNPNTGSFVLEFANTSPKEIIITDVLGRVLFMDKQARGTQQIQLDMVSGVYFLNIQQDGENATLRFNVVK